jgi:phosphopantetheinyl transferase (holo-ACP synthase)
LPYVGNDLVDLKELANAGKSQDSRFLRKILTDAEVEFVQSAENPDEALWSFWVCKETAYKVIKKSRSNTAFLPRQWTTIFNKYEKTYIDGQVIISGRDKIYVRIFSNSRYVHCVGADYLWALDKIVWDVDILPERRDGKNIDPSLFLRECLIRSLASSFCLKARDIKINRIKEKGVLRPPRVYINGKKSDIDISLSHDGQFVAYAFYVAYSLNKPI